MENFKKESSIKDKNDEEVFRTYMEDIRLTPEDFNKRILDVGAGTAQFAKWAREHEISNEIYSLESAKEHFVEKDKSVVARAETMPFKSESFDLVISNCAIPNVYINEISAEKMKENVKHSLFEMMRITRRGGEIRMGRVLIGKKYESQNILSLSIEESFKDLEEKDDIKIEKIRTPLGDTYEYDKNHKPTKLLAEAYLIIIRK